MVYDLDHIVNIAFLTRCCHETLCDLYSTGDSDGKHK